MALNPAAARVEAALAARGMGGRVREFAATTRSAAEAAAAIGCSVAEIAKSLVFRRMPSGKPVLVIASGVNRVDEALLAALLGEGIARPDAAYVRDVTGFAIGGIPPVGHAQPLETIIDEDLLRLAGLWAAAGTPNAVFSLTPRELLDLTGGRSAAIRA